MLPEGLSKLAEQGTPWTLLIAALVVIAVLFRMLIKTHEQCSSDYKTIISSATVAQQEANIANESRARAIDSNVRALELLAQAVTQLTNEIAGVTLAAREAQASHRAMREALLKKGVDL